MSNRSTIFSMMPAEIENLSPAGHGLRAAKNQRKWGKYAATLYAIKHGALKYYVMACAFEYERRVRNNRLAGYAA